MLTNNWCSMLDASSPSKVNVDHNIHGYGLLLTPIRQSSVQSFGSCFNLLTNFIPKRSNQIHTNKNKSVRIPEKSKFHKYSKGNNDGIK